MPGPLLGPAIKLLVLLVALTLSARFSPKSNLPSPWGDLLHKLWYPRWSAGFNNSRVSGLMPLLALVIKEQQSIAMFTCSWGDILFSLSYRASMMQTVGTAALAISPCTARSLRSLARANLLTAEVTSFKSTFTQSTFAGREYFSNNVFIFLGFLPFCQISFATSATGPVIFGPLSSSSCPMAWRPPHQDGPGNPWCRHRCLPSTRICSSPASWPLDSSTWLGLPTYSAWPSVASGRMGVGVVVLDPPTAIACITPRCHGERCRPAVLRSRLPLTASYAVSWT